VRATYGLPYARAFSGFLGPLGVVSAIAGVVADIRRYNSGSISGLHLTANLVATGVGFAGPEGAVLGLVYFAGELAYSSIDESVSRSMSQRTEYIGGGGVF
jgi:hypothetical protein